MQSMHTVNSNTKVTSDISDDTVIFNTGGRIFEIRRTLLHKFPDTTLAKLASDSWNKSSDDTPSVKISNTEKCCPAIQIFKDRDSVLFGFILDYMRDNGTVELPVTIPRDSFLDELKYYCFDINEDKTNYITHTIPVLDTFRHIDQLHKKFLDGKIEMNLVHDVRVLAYACYCELLARRSLDMSIDMKWSNAGYMLPQYLLTVNTKLIMGPISGKSVVNAMINLRDAYEKQTDADPMHPTIQNFNQDLSEFGFECKTFKCTSTENRCQYSVNITLKSIYQKCPINLSTFLNNGIGVMGSTGTSSSVTISNEACVGRRKIIRARRPQT